MPEVAVTPAPAGEVTGACTVCPHPWAGHDRIAARFCTATDAGGFSRGCACTPYSGDAAAELGQEELGQEGLDKTRGVG